MADDEDAQLKLRVTLMGTLGSIITPLRGLEAQLESELEELGLSEKYKSQCYTSRSTLARISRPCPTRRFLRNMRPR